METVGVVVGPWAVGGVRAAEDSLVWAGKGGLIITPLKRPRHSHPSRHIPAKEEKEDFTEKQTEDKEGKKDDEEEEEDEKEEEVENGEDPRKRKFGDSEGSRFIFFPPLVTVDTLEVSPCGRTIVVGGRVVGGEGVVVWSTWPLKADTTTHTLMSGHAIHHIEFSSKGDYLGVLSAPEVKKFDVGIDDDEAELVLTLWRWPTGEGLHRSDGHLKTHVDEELVMEDIDEFGDRLIDAASSPSHPQQVLVKPLPQLQAEQVNRMSLARGLPDGVVAAMIAAEEELSVWRVTEGPLGQRVEGTTIGFGLLQPDRVFSMYCLASDAYALGVGGGWVVVGVDGEVRVWLGGGGCRPCHQGPVTDLMLRGSHLYTVGGDGWLRVWEAETLEEAAVKAIGSGHTVKGWSEAGVTRAWLQLLREISVHKGPGIPVTLIPAFHQHSAWIVQTNTGMIYSIWEGEWTARILHQGPSGHVTGVAMSPNHSLMATTTQHRYLQVTALPKIYHENSEDSSSNGKRIVVPSSIAHAEVPGSPQCVTWAICQVAEDDNLLAVGLEDGSVNLYFLHLAPKTSSTVLTLVQTERPHESPITHITASKRYEPESNELMNVVVTASEDCRIFIFRLVKTGKITKLEPVGFHQLESVALRMDVKEAVIMAEMEDGIVTEIPIPSTVHSRSGGSSEATPSGDTPMNSNRATPGSWLLQRHPSRRELWEGSMVVRQQLLEEAAQTYCPGEPHTIVVSMPSLDGKNMLGVTSLGRVVHLHQSRGSYSIRLSQRSSVSLQRSPESPRRSPRTLRRSPDSRIGETLVVSPDTRPDHLNLSPTRHQYDLRRQVSPDEDESGEVCERGNVVGCVSDDGSWVAAWIEGADLLLYCATGSSFPSAGHLDLQLRQVGIRGVVIAESGPSLEQRAQKEAGERQKVAMEERASLLLQKLSKLKWDFRKISLRGDQLEGGQQFLEDLPLHPAITSSLNSQTTQNMNKVVGGSSAELERLEVLLGQLRTLYSWNPIVSTLNVKSFGSDEYLVDVDTSEEVYALLSQLAQVRKSGGEDIPGGAASTVYEVRSLLAYWLEAIRSGQQNVASNRSANLPDVVNGSENGRSKTEGGRTDNELRPEDTNANGRMRAVSSDGDTSEDDHERDSLASLQAQVREVVERVGSAGRGAGEGGASEADLDVGRELKWRRTALTRLQDYRTREESRTDQLTTYKTDHNLPLKEEGDDGDGEGVPADDDHDQDIEDEVTVPPVSVTVEEVENELWNLLGKVDTESKVARKKLEAAASTQLKVLLEANLCRAEWGHPALCLTHQLQHLNVKVVDELVNEFYCDLLDLDEPIETSGRHGPGDSTITGTGTSRRTKSSPRTPATESDRRSRHPTKKDAEGTDVPPLSLSGSPRMIKSSKTPRTGTTSRSLTTSRSTRTGRTGATTTRTPKTQRSGKGRRSVRDSPKPPPAPRPIMTLKQVQEIQWRRTRYLTELTQVPETVQDLAKEADLKLSELGRQVTKDQERLAWAVMRAGQLVKTVGVRVRYRDSEKKLRMALRERIKERQVVKEKVLALRERIKEYDRELECLLELEEEVERAFNHLVTDNAQFEVQLTRYFESRATPGLSRRQSVSSSSDGGESGDNDEEGGDSGDNDSGLGTDEARMDDNGPRPPGCDPAVFSLVTLLRDLKWRVAGAVERSRRERAGEERRHTAVLRRLVRANHLTHSALSALTNLQNDREKELGAIPTIVWLRKNQTSGNLGTAITLPYPNTQQDSLAAVRWPQEGSQAMATLLTRDHLQHLELRLAQARKSQELAIRKHRESRAERRALTQQVNQLRHELSTLQQAYQITRECKLGIGAEADLEKVKSTLEAGLDLRWPGKVASQMTRHENNVTQLQKDVAGRMRELRALQKEEAALAAHILALRQEKEHLLYHLDQTNGYPTSKKGKAQKANGRVVGQVEELERLRVTVAQQDTTISSLRREISTLRSKTGSVTIPGVPPLPPSKVRPSSSLPHTPHTHRSEHTYGGGSSMRPTTATDSSDGYAEEEMDVVEEEEFTSYYDDDDEEDEDDEDEDDGDENIDGGGEDDTVDESDHSQHDES